MIHGFTIYTDRHGTWAIKGAVELHAEPGESIEGVISDHLREQDEANLTGDFAGYSRAEVEAMDRNVTGANRLMAGLFGKGSKAA